MYRRAWRNTYATGARAKPDARAWPRGVVPRWTFPFSASPPQEAPGASWRARQVCGPAALERSPALHPFLHNPVAVPRPAAPRPSIRLAPRWPPVGPRQPGPAGHAPAPPPQARAAGRRARPGSLSFAAMPGQSLDVTAASAHELEALHGVGPRSAQVIIQVRERAGRFESLQDLSDRVRGIGR